MRIHISFKKSMSHAEETAVKQNWFIFKQRL